MFGGIEGGATHSTVVILNTEGHIHGPFVIEKATNLWTVGRENCYQNILDMIHEAKLKAGCALETPLQGLCLSLSGMEVCRCATCKAQPIQDVREREKLVDALKQRDANLAQNYSVCNDSMGALWTASANGGIVLIAGTGSMCRFVTVSGSAEQHYRCGGWGHMIGDDGAAFYITRKAVQTVYRAGDRIMPRLDGVTETTRDADLAWLKAKCADYFQLQNPNDILPHLYTNFEKPKFSGFAASVAEGAEHGPALLHGRARGFFF